ncbi:PH domain-containing protein [Sphingobacterium sp. UT-1RO-CII-1]|uniref:PH domain-containing protein n=1 Tax=Sphingobacterium sp. UT-1RO-CII-1 TaxID=2995225 RepID=UPI00227C7573|nr:PH domain-containing protein [Sphingobacterium sp. UT-1RO-CII-1]MCY4780118.1 PH domain-containing protein [Sphingobacterium sp. UT-1RO-CII-1]
MNIDKFLQDGQDPKVLEKIHNKIVDMLTADEYIQYISLQKKPAVTLLPDSIAVSNKRLFLCEFTKLGLATNFEIFTWNDIKDISFKEEIFGSKVTVIPFRGENLTIDYIPKVQARKLYQLIKDALENVNKPLTTGNIVTEIHTSILTETIKPDVTSETIEVEEVIEPTFEILPPEEEKMQLLNDQAIEVEQEQNEDDELTQRLKKLKNLYDRQLITQAEYESKKSELLSQL